MNVVAASNALQEVCRHWQVLLDLTRERGLTDQRVVEAALVDSDSNDTVDIIYGRVAPSRLDEDRVARKRKRMGKAKGDADPAPLVTSAFLVLPAVHAREASTLSVKRLLGLEACAHAAADAAQPPQRVYLCLVDAGHISYYHLAAQSPPRLALN